ncbi:PAS domain-containing hybrid sensor histidine kinase/response regulator [Oricola indica]|jgi:Na+/proline symporter/signal transduction histidine kinase/CheY-like chemotaxis protein|uniref:PAS domain-containing hybrid sensor histidine kinase/response regulator n=1 Tax=Oricola indica TaxID=2872591 RepID=UPI001CBBEB00|nr:PAS-domain containing protein [Oricola indica]
MQGGLIIIVALGYLAILFAVAAYGDRRSRGGPSNVPRPNIYALSLAVYCTSWTFFGSVGVASQSGFQFFTIYLGPILVFTLGYKLIERIVVLSKAEKITSVADFLAARYGKNAWVAALAAVIAVIGTVPYIALQLKAISDSVTLMAGHYDVFGNSQYAFRLDISLVVALFLSVFAILFGTRHADATEHQDGLILAVALESLVKIIVFLVVASAVVFFMYGGPGPIFDAIRNDERVVSAISRGSSPSTWIVMTLLSASAILALPRQFHVTVVENRADVELRRARWMFPLYLIVINVLVLPLAVAGMLNLGPDVSPDSYVLALPLSAGQDFLAFLTFTGGLSAATAMVIVASVALAVMISNDLVIPLLLWRSGGRLRTDSGDWTRVILNIRRISIFIMLIAAFAYYRAAANTTQLAAIGLLSFAAVAQFAPALVIGLFWRGANARGAILGMGAGFVVWAYTLLFPTLLGADDPFIRNGIFGIDSLRPQALFGVVAEPLNHGVFWSLLVNVVLLVIGSISRAQSPLERLQAITFVPRDAPQTVKIRRFRTTITINDLKATLSRYVGRARTERAFAAFEEREGRSLDGRQTTDITVVRYAEQILASAVGSSSARLVLSLLFEKDGASSRETVQLLDDASEALQQNRDLLQMALNQMDQGISVFDKNLRLTNWNTQFRALLSLPSEMGQFGYPIKLIMERLVSDGQVSEEMAFEAVDNITAFKRVWQLPLKRGGRILEVRSNPMPDGGIVVTYTDITGRVEADEALKRAKESLEQRVAARTAELTNVNRELARAQALAEEANLGKTRFLAAAGHDISQPLNAARLYTSSLVERTAGKRSSEREIATKIDSSLQAVENIIGAVLDISRLDAGAMTPNPSVFSLGELLNQIKTDFQPLADEKKLEFVVVPSTAVVESDRNLLRRLVQNLVSNALKYTKTGKVLVGVRRDGDDALICVHDTGIGISSKKAKTVFKEFERLSEGARIASGLGLGLSIVDRISRVLGLTIDMKSRQKTGTMFTVRIKRSSEALIAKPARVSRAAGARQVLAGIVVACIDNEETILSGMRVLLEGWGAQVIAAPTQKTLLGEISKAGVVPDVIIADYHLDDGHNGLDVIAAMRSRLSPKMFAILATADRSAPLRAAAANADIHILNKPLKPAALRALLSNVSQERAAAE